MRSRCAVEVLHVLRDEWVRRALGQSRERVVHVAVMTLVREHVLEAVDPLRVVVELPVGLGDARRGEAVPLVVEFGARRRRLFD